MSQNRYIEGLNYDTNHPFYKESLHLASKYGKETYKYGGIVRWKSNKSIPPVDVLEFWHYIGKDINLQKNLTAKEKEQTKLMEQYRKQQMQRGVSNEELAEMRAAFGPGVEVVDVITGRKTRT